MSTERRERGEERERRGEERERRGEREREERRERGERDNSLLSSVSREPKRERERRRNFSRIKVAKVPLFFTRFEQTLSPFDPSFLRQRGRGDADLGAVELLVLPL